jgi:hypothetical protein
VAPCFVTDITKKGSTLVRVLGSSTTTLTLTGFATHLLWSRTAADHQSRSSRSAFSIVLPMPSAVSRSNES